MKRAINSVVSRSPGWAGEMEARSDDAPDSPGLCDTTALQAAQLEMQKRPDRQTPVRPSKHQK